MVFVKFVSVRRQIMTDKKILCLDSSGTIEVYTVLN